jgi:hypothetical protein
MEDVGENARRAAALLGPLVLGPIVGLAPEPMICVSPRAMIHRDWCGRRKTDAHDGIGVTPPDDLGDDITLPTRSRARSSR